MATGIVQTMLQTGMTVIQKGRSQNSIDRSRKGIEKSLSRLVEKGKLEQAACDAMLAKLTTTLAYEPLADADIVIEAIAEELTVKQEILQELDKLCKPETIIATNTSSLSITALASVTNRPAQIVGMHFFNPVPMMKLVEIIRGQRTSDAVHDTIFKLAEQLGKTPVTVSEAPGFVVNRILIPMINEAVGILADGVASREAIDEAMKLGANHPMGPLALGDLIGLDVCLAIMEVLYSEFGDPKYRPHPLLRKMVRANLLGRKSGEGFYCYK